MSFSTWKCVILQKYNGLQKHFLLTSKLLTFDSVLFLSLSVDCGCSFVGSMPEICNVAGQCLCRPEFTGPRCDQCRSGFHSYPNCQGKTHTQWFNTLKKGSVWCLQIHCLYYFDNNYLDSISQCALVTLAHLWTPAVPCRVSVTADPTTVAPNVTSVHPDITPIPAAHVSHMTLIKGQHNQEKDCLW